MQEKYAFFLQKIGQRQQMILLALMFVLFAGVIMPSLEADIKALSGGIGVLDLQCCYSPATARKMLGAYGPEGRHLYLIAQWTADLVFPVIGGLFFTSALLWSGARRWYLMGLVLCVVDWTENIFISILLVQYPSFNSSIALLSTGLTLSKWTVVASSSLIFTWHIYLKIRRK
jgi:hypothetical protein